MNKLVSKIASLLPILEARGPVYLFALGEREDVNQWDVILSASWSDESYTQAVRVVADVLVPLLEKSEFTILAGIVVIPSSEPNIVELPRSLENVSPEEDRIVNLTLMGLEVRRAFIFKAKRPERMESAGASVAAHTL